MAARPAQLTRELTPTPQGAEAARSFYQVRLALFFQVITASSTLFFIVHNCMEVLSGHLATADVFRLPLNRWHLTGAAVSGLLGLLAKLRPFTMRTLGMLDAGGALGVVFAHDMMGMTLLGVPAPHFDLVLTLQYMLFHLTRCVIVPSTARRTLLLCAATALPLLTITALLAAYAPDGWSAARTIYAPVYVGLWALVSALPAGLGSDIIYGLRRQVREARQLGQYTLEEQIGAGGMGTVYRARHALLRRPTAIKLLRPERGGEQALARFEREVQLTSLLTHPNTVAIYDYGRTEDGVFYYAMEYLDGLDLQRVIDLDGAQSPARVAHILVQVCRALAEAHALGLVHRDIKPGNIILCERGGVPDVAKVVDFGLVKDRLSDARGEGTLVSAVHAIVGTPYFLAPEAVRSPEHVDARSDLYAVGAVGYFLLTGRPVFEGESAMEVLGHHLHSEPVPPSVRSGRTLPARLEQLLLACLIKDPAARPQSAATLARLLEDAGAGSWSDESARAWWNASAARRADKALSAPESALSPTLIAIDLRYDVRGGA